MASLPLFDLSMSQVVLYILILYNFLMCISKIFKLKMLSSTSKIWLHAISYLNSWFHESPLNETAASYL
jgi:hypothetical protein